MSSVGFWNCMPKFLTPLRFQTKYSCLTHMYEDIFLRCNEYLANNLQFSGGLPTHVRAGALGLKASHALGDGLFQLTVWAPLSYKEAYRLIPLSASSISLDTTFKLD